MAILNDVDLELGTTAEFSATSGNVSATTAARMAGTAYGLKVDIAGVGNNYATVNYADSVTGKHRNRFYFDPNTLTMANNDTFTLAYAQSSTPATYYLVVVTMSGGGYYIRGAIVNDAAAITYTTNYLISDAPHRIEVYVQQAATDVSSDGSLAFYIDGVLMETITGKDNYDRMSNDAYTQLGAVSAMAGTSGSIYIDQIVINDDGAEIGPCINPANGGAVFGYNTVSNNESAISWKKWDDGSAGAITVSGDADWGKGELAIGEEMRSPVYDLSEISTRTFTLTENKYGAGSGTATLQYRGQDASFDQDDVGPAWTEYTVPFDLSCRYFQIMEIKSS